MQPMKARLSRAGPRRGLRARLPFDSADRADTVAFYPWTSVDSQERSFPSDRPIPPPGEPRSGAPEPDLGVRVADERNVDFRIRTARMGSLLRERCAAIAFFLVTAPLLPAQSYMLVDGQDAPPANTRYVIEGVEGRVVVGGGASPPGRVRVALVCGSFVRPGGLADEHGRFKHSGSGVTQPCKPPSSARQGRSAEPTLEGRQIVYPVPEQGSAGAVRRDCRCSTDTDRQAPKSDCWSHDGITIVGDRRRMDLGFLVLHHLEDLDHYARSSTTSQATGVARQGLSGRHSRAGEPVSRLRAGWHRVSRGPSRPIPDSPGAGLLWA